MSETPHGADVTDATPLPDYYATVARDMREFCGTEDGRVWVDLGCGRGEVGLALFGLVAPGTLVFVDPASDPLRDALGSARRRGWAGRVVAVRACAEDIPLADASVDCVVSRGSFYFWKDRARGLREVWRILRAGGRAMIGGGLGSAYPAWARREFIRRKREAEAAKGPDAARAFAEARSAATFRRLAAEAGLPSFDVIGEGGQGPKAPDAGIGIWLRMRKEDGNGT
jgi:SAM-dependent methyltransferase